MYTSDNNGKFIFLTVPFKLLMYVIYVLITSNISTYNIKQHLTCDCP